MREKLQHHLGSQVRALRLAKGMTQGALADLMATGEQGFTIESVGNIERGRTLPALETLARLAEAFGVSMSELLDFPSDDANQEPRRVELEARLREVARQLPDDRLEIAVAQIEHLILTTSNEPVANLPQRGRGGKPRRIVRA